MSDFASQLEAWQAFYSTVSLAAVTLAGLLFVSLSLRADRLGSPEGARYLRLAKGSFGDFLYVLMLGLVFLVPHAVPAGLAIALFVLGGARAGGLARQLGWARRSKSALVGDQAEVLREVALPGMAAVGLLLVGVAVMLGAVLAIFGLVLVVAVLLASASWNAWLILVGDLDDRT